MKCDPGSSQSPGAEDSSVSESETSSRAHRAEGQKWKSIWRRTVKGIVDISDEVPRVDDPPYKIVEPSCDDGGRDPRWLCENMPAEPSLAFDQRTDVGRVFEDEGLFLADADGDAEFYAALLTDADDLERLSDAPELVAETDFAAEAVLVVQTGYGSSSVKPHVKRIEATDEGIRAFGCYEDPCYRTEDVTTRAVMVRFERPETLESAVVSLTVRDGMRVTFSADDGIVTVEDGAIVDDSSDPQFPSVDEPPYAITEPPCDDDGRRDPLWLCEHVPAEPSLAFEQARAPSTLLRDEGLTLDHPSGESEFYAALVSDRSDLERIDRDAGGDAADLIEATDVSSEAVLVVQTGYGSSSVFPHVKRVAETDDGIHANGCYYRPCAGTGDVAVRTIVVRFDRPETLETAAVSLTTDAETRVNFTTDNDVVTVEDGEVM